MGKHIALIDQEGRWYNNATEAARAYGIDAGRLRANIAEYGRYENPKKGISLFPANDSPSDAKLPASVRKIMERFSTKELQLLANGIGTDRAPKEVPKIQFEGDRTFHILVLSDTHIGSVYSPDGWLREAIDYANRGSFDAVLNCGDTFEGGKIGRFGSQVYELSEIGLDRQLEKACRFFRELKVPMYLISGNHDRFFNDFAGADACKRLCENIECATFLGDDNADIRFGNVLVRMVHGGDASSYALSYPLQKLIEGYKEGEERPHLLFKGHLHKYNHSYVRGINAFLCPALQQTTGWMRGKRMYSQVGFLDVSFDSCEKGLCNLNVRPIFLE